jgi:RHS repeat-associated protein
LEYLYDGYDQLRRATKKVNNVVQGSEEYWYDSAGARVAIVKRNSSGARTELITFVGDVQAHYNGSGTNTKVYSHLSLGTPVARLERTATATALEYQFHGLANNTIAAVASNGTINASFSYAPFGELLETTNAGGSATGVAAHKRRFNDKYQDDVSGLGYYGARYYDKTLMGWTQADPLYLRNPDMADLPRSANIYQFVLNNPLSYIDPDGLRDQKIVPTPDAPGTATHGSVSDYRSEGEIRDQWRRAYQADAAWEVDTNTCAYNTNQCSFILGQGGTFAGGFGLTRQFASLPNSESAAGPLGVPKLQVASSKSASANPFKKPIEWLVRKIFGKKAPKAKPKGGPIAQQTKKELLKSQAKLQKRIAEHQKKLADYKANPEAHDNLGVLTVAKHSGNKELYNKIYQGRIKALEDQIRKQQGELAKVTSELSRR